ncbi:extensin family protein [Limimaricola pyoseonensis]|uniref:Uncharacterized conserved protein n=1 Tax=Limimaricola pyoseonensis TaxID=521013 RepID=A0A1G7GYZ0_9RHOB|nr:extensin family protein [Limimaricola pyoseonensis]SDE93400.1 Uncharacterized conserved protein [Limimaricola pyoseonensis]
MRGAVLALTLLALPAAAQETTPETVPLPEPRPEGLGEAADAAQGAAGSEEASEDAAEAEDGAGEADAEAADEAPDDAPGAEAEAADEAPEDAPGADTPAETGEGADAEAAETPEDTDPPVRAQLAASEADRAACRAALDALGAVWEEVDPVTDPEVADCGIDHPLRLSAVRPGVALSPPAPMRCETALALARWSAGFIEPAAERLGRGALTAISHGTTYNCRGRSSDAGTLSEHAFGNAVDVMGFEFAEGAPVAVEPRERDGTMAEAFQDAVRATACLEFTTVLGPGTDAAHADHLHLDVKARNGGFRLCQ